MDSFELNKIAGAVLGTLTLTLGLVIASEGLFHSAPPEKAGYELPDEEVAAEGGGEEAAAVEPIAARLVSADAERGEAIARRCASCHDFQEGGPNKVGPDLYNVVNRPKASAPGFAYSAAMKEKGGEWSYENLDHFLENPKGFISGTTMSFAGLRRPDERAHLIAYLRTLSHSPAPLPEAPPPSDAAQPEAPAGDSGQQDQAPAGGDTQPAPGNPGTQAPATDSEPAPQNTAPAGEQTPGETQGKQPAQEGEKPDAGQPAQPEAPAQERNTPGQKPAQ
jgi:cytochrome c